MSIRHDLRAPGIEPPIFFAELWASCSFTHELADNAGPLPTYERWQVFTDLCLWADEATLDIPTLTRFDDHGYPVDMTAQATAVIYEVAHRLTWIILTELSKEDA